MRCSMVSPQPNIMVAVVRIPSACAVRCTSIQSCADDFNRLILRRTSSSKISAPPPGIDSQPRIPQPRNRVAQVQSAHFRDVDDLGR